MSGADLVLDVQDVHKTFRIGFFRKRVDAVRGVSFSVRRGEIFGLLGPNGAGKTTTIKMALRLIFPNQGAIKIFGMPAGNRESMFRVGYLPESPYIYQYLKPLEFLDLCGRLTGLKGADRRKRSMAILERVGLSHAIDRPIGKFSKGMMQRIGLAQALLHDPEFLILDEPMSGLDPIGRKEVRDIIDEQKRAGKTLLFTSHILSDVAQLCDRVAIVNRGRITSQGTLDELLRPEVRRVEVELDRVTPELRMELERRSKVTGSETRVVCSVEGEVEVPALLQAALTHKAHVISVTPHRESLEDLFVRNAMAAGD